MNRNIMTTGAILLAALIGIGLWVQAGEIQPPPGPVGPTMKTLADLSDEHAAIQAALAGGAGSGSIKQIVRGVIEYVSDEKEREVVLPTQVNPEKCLVLLSDVVMNAYAAPTTNTLAGRNGAAVVSLTQTHITVGVDYQPFLRRVSYQIIEYN
jgi:hypothetical protein